MEVRNDRKREINAMIVDRLISVCHMKEPYE